MTSQEREQEQKQQRASDLLAHRDGERLDPEVSAQIDADPDARGELDVLRRIKHQLNELPAIDPDPAVWARISQSSEASQPQQSRRSWTLRYPVATAASVFLAAALAIVTWNPLREEAGSAVVLADGGLQDLMSRSRALEAQLPARGLAAAQFTGNSSQQALMYRIADIDSELTRQYEAPQPDLARCETLWSQRVMLLESLADVQRGQAVVRPAVY